MIFLCKPPLFYNQSLNFHGVFGVPPQKIPSSTPRHAKVLMYLTVRLTAQPSRPRFTGVIWGSKRASMVHNMQYKICSTYWSSLLSQVKWHAKIHVWTLFGHVWTLVFEGHRRCWIFVATGASSRIHLCPGPLDMWCFLVWKLVLLDGMLLTI